MDAPIYTFHRMGNSPAPAYRVDANGVTIGWCAATTDAPYPGRSRSRYDAYSILKSTSVGRRDSRSDAAEAIYESLRSSARGRQLRSKVG